MKLLTALFRGRIQRGRLTLIGPDGARETFEGAAPGPEVALAIHDPDFGRRLLVNPELRFAEGYMDGAFDVAEGSLHGLLTLMRINRGEIERSIALRVAQGAGRAMSRAHQFNPPSRAKSNAAAHYDLGNDLYRLFLDADMQYSCAYFPRGDESLEAAQLAKKRHIAAKLRLEPGMSVLDIGCGWGGLALYFARVADVEVLGVTLAEEQLRVARERAEREGLSNRVRFELRDYRDIDERFDRVVSVGMLEHVGGPHLGGYFAGVRETLSARGVALVHSIISMRGPVPTGPFLRKYIFPGGHLPALSETAPAIEDAGLWLLDAEIWRRHYAFTLDHWARRFAVNRDRARALYDERFCRMWEFYLRASQVAFEVGNLAVMQLQLGRERDAVPLSRDYVGAETESLRAREAELGLA